ncbi:hypothetical protein [Ensifer aridi]|uniref:hypothetical protein n=1 Tax=Ensifer aridi TaxID=1708715 RepID=UPI000A11B08A|nr:hypothetical protein [Ensifer aridi]
MNEQFAKEIDSLADEAGALFEEIAAASHDGRGIARAAFSNKETAAGEMLEPFARTSRSMRWAISTTICKGPIAHARP